MTRRFERPLRIRFSHCDPAGIVFYPQYFVLFNGLVEDWVSEALGIPYAALIGERRVGLPTVSLQCDFKAVCRMGDDVCLGLALDHIGRSSLRLRLDCRRGDTLCVAATSTLVTTNLDRHRAIALPADLHAAMLAFQAP